MLASEQHSRYIILKFGTRRVLLLSRYGESATMTQHPEGYLTFDYSSCDVIGMLDVSDRQPEPQPEDFMLKADYSAHGDACDGLVVSINGRPLPKDAYAIDDVDKFAVLTFRE